MSIETSPNTPDQGQNGEQWSILKDGAVEETTEPTTNETQEEPKRVFEATIVDRRGFRTTITANSPEELQEKQRDFYRNDRED